MRTSWLAGFALLFLIGTIISLTLEGQYFGVDDANVFYRLMNPDFGNFSNPLTAIGGFFIMAWTFVQALWAIFWWDYSFLTGSWEILRYAGWALSVSMIVTIVLAVRGSSSV